MVRKSELVAILMFAALLLISGILIFIWMAASHWVDKTGVSVSIIFIILSGLQALFIFGWYRFSKRQEGLAIISHPEESVEMVKDNEAKHDGLRQRTEEATA